MIKTIFSTFLLITIAAGFVMAETGTEPTPSARASFKKGAVAPFLVGRHQPQMDEAMDETLSCPIGEICSNDPMILPTAGPRLTELVSNYLRKRFGNHMVSQNDVTIANIERLLDSAKDTPRSMAQKLGERLDVDAVFIGIVWRYRNRGAIEGVPDSPASVAFAVYMIESQTGRQLWRGIYSGSQQSLMDNLSQAKKLLKMGLKWLSADELAEFGVQEMFENFMPQIQPDQPAPP